MHNKKIVYSYLIISLFMFFSCGEFHKVLNKGTLNEQYKMAVKLYESQEYGRALQLFEKIVPSFRGKPQMERIQFMVANANFNQKNYGLAGYYFDRFSNNYSSSSKVEDAEFLSALGYYYSAPKFSLDPTDTEKALNAFQKFIDKYPNSSRAEEANSYYNKLKHRIEKKQFEIAKTYYKTANYDYRNYKAAITSFDNLLSEHLGTKYKEEALYYRFKASYDYAFKSTKRRRLERINEALKSYEKLKRNFPESNYLKDADKLFKSLEKEKQNLKIS